MAAPQGGFHVRNRSKPVIPGLSPDLRRLVAQVGRRVLTVWGCLPYLGETEHPLRVERVAPAPPVAHGRHAVLVLLNQAPRHKVAVADGLHLW